MNFMLKIIFLLIISGTLLLAEEKSSSLEMAYKKEFAFLEAEKRNLQNRSSEIDKESSQKIKSAENEIAALSAKIIELSSKADNLTLLMDEVAREEESDASNIERVETVISQADILLERFGKKIPEKEKKYEALEFAFQNISLLIKNLSEISKTNGEFFLADGTKVSGNILKIGNIASYGISEKSSGALAPAGDNKLVIWENSKASTAKALFEGKKPENLDIFLYESLDKKIEKKKKQSLTEYTTSGGSLAWVIVFVGVFAVIMVVLRAIFLKLSSSNTEKMSKEIAPLVKEGKIAEALEACKKRSGASPRVLAAVLRNIDREREHLEDIISEAILHENSYLDKFGSFIIVLASIAPLLGLLGTVTGMIETFDVITEFGNSDPKMLSSGISVALITTEYGLYVAIPALFFGNLLNGWAENIKDEMEKGALNIRNIYLNIKTTGEK